MFNTIFLIGLITLSLFFNLFLFASSAPIIISQAEIDQAKKKHGELVARRLTAWQELVTKGYKKPERLKLQMVNKFFNGARFASDKEVWKQEDYWATPIELLTKDAGDCEDYVIAKYITLKAMGVDESKIYLTYVKAVRLRQAHMVLTYFKTPSSIPLVLDNINNRILKSTVRKDLIPIYSFNGDGLWLAKQRGKGETVKGGTKGLDQWQSLLKKLNKEAL